MFQFLQSLDAVLSGRLLLLRGGGHQPVKMVAEHTTVDCHPKTMCRIRREENWWQNPDGLRKRRLRGLGARGIGRNPEENYGSWNNTVSGKGGSHCCLDPARGQREHVKYDTDWSLIDEIKLLLILGGEEEHVHGVLRAEDRLCQKDTSSVGNPAWIPQRLDLTCLTFLAVCLFTTSPHTSPPSLTGINPNRYFYGSTFLLPHVSWFSCSVFSSSAELLDYL